MFRSKFREKQYFLIVEDYNIGTNLKFEVQGNAKRVDIRNLIIEKTGLSSKDARDYLDFYVNNQEIKFGTKIVKKILKRFDLNNSEKIQLISITSAQN